MYSKILVSLNEIATKFINEYDLGKGLKAVPKNRLQNHLVYGGVVRKEEQRLWHDTDNDQNALYIHKRYQGVIETQTKLRMMDPNHLERILSEENLNKIYCMIKSDPSKAFEMTCKKNMCGIITNGTAVLGLGSIGSTASLPVMEGKSVLFKEFGNVDCMPICIKTQDKFSFVSIVERICPTFSAINLEDIKAPDCFYIENSLYETSTCPIFHDDQHGTAIIVVAALINALKLVDKKFEELKIVINGAGAAGLSITELLLKCNATNIVICDTRGAIYKQRTINMNDQKIEMAHLTNPNDQRGPLSKVIEGADVFIGVSSAKALKGEWITKMNDQPIIFALANPTPEIMPDEAKQHGAYIVATGRSDFPNQVNNSLAFPGVFRAILDIRASEITMDMKMAAALAIANCVKEYELCETMIVPDPLNYDVPVQVATTVAKTAMDQEIISAEGKVAYQAFKSFFSNLSLKC